MILSILIAGVAIGSIYAMIGICYNIMYSTSKVLSFTSGQLGMIGAVFGAWFIGDLQWDAPVTGISHFHTRGRTAP